MNRRKVNYIIVYRYNRNSFFFFKEKNLLILILFKKRKKMKVESANKKNEKYESENTGLMVNNGDVMLLASQLALDI